MGPGVWNPHVWGGGVGVGGAQWPVLKLCVQLPIVLSMIHVPAVEFRAWGPAYPGRTVTLCPVV